jgi:hypothetical protein
VLQAQARLDFSCVMLGLGVNGRLNFVTVFTVRNERRGKYNLRITSFRELQELNPKCCSIGK